MANNTYGGFFYRLIGKKANQCADLGSIDGAVEEKTGQKLHIESYGSNVVHTRGNVLRYSKRDEDLDSKIDQYLTSK